MLVRKYGVWMLPSPRGLCCLVEKRDEVTIILNVLSHCVYSVDVDADGSGGKRYYQTTPYFVASVPYP